MSYWEMDDAFLGHHKTRRAVRAGAEALVMWFAMRTYVALNLTDGIVPDDDIDDLPNAPKNPRRWLNVLVECGASRQDGTRGAGLVDHYGKDWKLHDYEHHAMTRAKIEERKSSSATRSALRASPELMSAVKDRDASRCRYCGIAVRWNDRKGPFGGTYDHVIPLTKGGTNTFENVVVSCRGCASKKQARTPEESGMKLLDSTDITTGRLPVNNQTDLTNASGHISHPIPSHDQNLPDTEIQRPVRPQATDMPEIQQRCLRLRRNPHDGAFENVSSWPEILAVSDAFWRVMKLSQQRLGTYGRDKGLTAVCELYADGFSQEQLVRAVNAMASDEWVERQKRPGLTMLTPEVVRRLLEKPREHQEPRSPARKTLAEVEAESELARTKARDQEENARPRRRAASPQVSESVVANALGIRAMPTKSQEDIEERRRRDLERLREFEEEQNRGDTDAA